MGDIHGQLTKILERNGMSEAISKQKAKAKYCEKKQRKTVVRYNMQNCISREWRFSPYRQFPQWNLQYRWSTTVLIFWNEAVAHLCGNKSNTNHTKILT